VAANPDDDGPLRVLADALIERGLPQGEFIALELGKDARGKVTGLARHRHQELLSAHAKEWIPPNVGSPAFHRGLLSRGDLLGATDPAHLSWRTLDTLLWRVRPEVPRGPLLRAPNLVALRSLFGVSLGVFEEFCTTPRPRLQSLRLHLAPAYLPSLMRSLPARVPGLLNLGLYGPDGGPGGELDAKLLRAVCITLPPRVTSLMVNLGTLHAVDAQEVATSVRPGLVVSAHSDRWGRA
jgi:hypothetical protein